MKVNVPALGFFKKTIISFVNKSGFFIFLLTIFFINLPPFKLVNLNFTSHMAVKLINLALLLVIIRESKFISLKKSSILKLGALLLLTHSASVINVLDTYAFLSQYEDFVFGIIYLILSLFYLNVDKNLGKIVQILIVLVLSTSLNTLFELLILIFPNAIISNNLLNDSQLNLIVYNLNRGRIYYESFSQTLIPILFWFITSTKSLRFKAISTILLIIIFFNTSISNNRSFAFMLIFATIPSLLFFIRRKILIIFSLILIIVSTTALFISKNIIGTNLIDRIYMNDARADYETLVFRKNMILEGIKVNQANPIFGIGLGNLNYYFSTNINTNIFMQENVYRRNLPSSSNYIHNLLVTTLAETGILGFLAIVLLLLDFLSKDLKNVLREKNNLKKAVIISFWTLILFSLFNPHMIIRFYVLFWLYRIIIERLRVQESIKI